MLGAGTVINPILKIVTTVAILAAAYFFIVKPILDTTEDTFNTAFDSFDGFGDLPTQIQDDIDDALGQANGTDATRLSECIQRAIDDGANRGRIDRCLNRFGP